MLLRHRPPARCNPRCVTPGAAVCKGYAVVAGSAARKVQPYPEDPERVTVRLVQNVPDLRFSPSPILHILPVPLGVAHSAYSHASGEREGGRPPRSGASRFPRDPAAHALSRPLANAASILRHPGFRPAPSAGQGPGCQRHVAGGEAGKLASCPPSLLGVIRDGASSASFRPALDDDLHGVWAGTTR
jgi:hypothetical protein